MIIEKYNNNLPGDVSLQNDCLTNIETLPSDIAKKIISKISFPEFTPITAQISEFSSFSPGNTCEIKSFYPVKIIRCSDNRQIASAPNGYCSLPYNTFLFSSQDKFLLYCTAQRSLQNSLVKGWDCKLINTLTQKETTINNVIWTNNTDEHVQTIDNKNIIAQFSPDEKYVLICTYDAKNNNPFENRQYKIFSTESDKEIKTIDKHMFNQGQNDTIAEVSFCSSNILFIKRTKGSANSNESSISFIDIANNQKTGLMEANRYLLNNAKDILIYISAMCSDFNSTIHSYNLINKDFNSTPLNVSPNQIMWAQHPKNDLILMYVKNEYDQINKIYIHDKKNYKFFETELPESLENISIEWAHENNNFLIIGKQIGTGDRKPFLYIHEEKKYQKIFADEEDKSSLYCKFIPGDKKIICHYQDNTNISSTIHATIYNIEKKEHTKLTLTFALTNNDTIFTHPTKPHIYSLSKKNESLLNSKELTIYDTQSEKIIGKHTIENIDDTQFIKKCLSKDGRFLILYTPKETSVINTTTTQQKIISWDTEAKEKIKNIAWHGNELMIEYHDNNAQKDEMITFEPTRTVTANSQTITSLLPEINIINNNTPETNTIKSKPETNEKITTSDKTPYVLLGGAAIGTIVILIALYTHYPELFKILLQSLKIA